MAGTWCRFAADRGAGRDVRSARDCSVVAVFTQTFEVCGGLAVGASFGFVMRRWIRILQVIAIAAFAENDDGTAAEHHTRPGIEVFLLLAFTEQATLWTVLT